MDTKMAPTEPGWIQNHWAYQKAIDDVLALPEWAEFQMSRKYANRPVGKAGRLQKAIEALRGEREDE